MMMPTRSQVLGETPCPTQFLNSKQSGLITDHLHTLSILTDMLLCSLYLF